MAVESKTFKQNYDTLKRVSESIKNQNEPDIDAIVPLVDEALLAYSACKERLSMVKQALGEKLPMEMPQ